MIHALYSSTETHFEFQGAVVAAVLVNSGIRQVCPLSGTLFALAADRAHVMYLGACISLFANDVAIVVVTILRSLDALPDGLRR